MITPTILRFTLIACATVAVVPSMAADRVPVHQQFLNANCKDCHEGASAEAGFDIAKLDQDLANPESLQRWIRVYDRVKAGEMPPADVADVSANSRDEFLRATDGWITEFQQEQWNRIGRVKARRLTHKQLERSLQDVLGIDVPLAEKLPEESRTNGFTTVAHGQSLSHFQLQQHLGVVDVALDEAFRRAMSKPDEAEWELSARQLSRRRLQSRCREPEFIDNKAVTWSSRLVFYGRLPSTTARVDGWYRFTFDASALNCPKEHGVWCTVRTGQCVSTAPLMNWVGAFEVTPDPETWTFEAWIPKGHMIEIRPGDLTLKGGRSKGGQVGTGEIGPQKVPGVALHSMKVERIHHGSNDKDIRKRLFGNLKIEWWKKDADLNAENPKQAAAELLRSFAESAFRRPVSDDVVAPYIAMVKDSLDAGNSLVEALRFGYRAILCSPRFMYFYEQPGRLDDYAIASRLSYFLWNTTPDAELLRLAKAEKLHQPEVLRAQINRMLADAKGKDFVKDFAAEWLDLSLIDFTEPDRKLHPKFDVVVQQSMLDETHAFLQSMLDENLSVTHLIDSDFTFLNSRLARFYEMDSIAGDELRKVSLSAKDARGGLLTQGAILKVTANGTTTSPVIRGVWVSERLLGEHVPPPPANVPAIEPDIRGAKSIRDMLAKHRSQDSCAACHTKIDPAGFALENFDAAGQWRDAYFGIQRGRRSKGIKIDASYELPNGQKFEDLHGFKKLVTRDPKPLAENVAEKMLTYGSGAPVTFADREAIEEIVTEAAPDNYGFRSLLLAMIEHRIFLCK